MLLYKQITSLDKTKLKKTMSLLLKEDTPRGDSTTQAIISKSQRGTYTLRSREKMVFCGGPIIQSAFSKSVTVNLLVKDGQHIKPNIDIAKISGNVREILIKAVSGYEPKEGIQDVLYLS